MKQNGVVCQPGPVLLFFIFRFEYLISGPKSYRDFRETSPWSFKNVSVVGENYWRWKLKFKEYMSFLQFDSTENKMFCIREVLLINILLVCSPLVSLVCYFSCDSALQTMQCKISLLRRADRLPNESILRFTHLS